MRFEYTKGHFALNWPLKDFQSNQKAQGNSVMRSMFNDFKNEIKMDLTEQKTQLAKQQLTLSNTNKVTTTLPKK